jgi:hypothetical protein
MPHKKPNGADGVSGKTFAAALATSFSALNHVDLIDLTNTEVLCSASPFIQRKGHNIVAVAVAVAELCVTIPQTRSRSLRISPGLLLCFDWRNWRYDLTDETET